MRKLLIMSFFLVLWGGFKFPREAEDILVKSISRPDQIAELILFCSVLVVLFLIVGKRIILNKTLFPRALFQKHSVYIFILYFGALMSSGVSYYPSYSFFRAAQYLIGILLIGYMLEEIPDKKVLITAIYVFSVINLCYVAAAYIFFPEVVLGAEGRLAGGGIFRGDNGEIPFVACIFSFCYYLTLKKRFSKTIHFSIFLLSGVFMFLYQTRHLLYPTPFLLLFILLFYKKISFRSFSFIFLFALGLILLDYAGVPMVELFTRRQGFTSESRVETWKVVIENISQVPVLGFGFLGTPAFFVPLKESLIKAKILITADPHNFFLAAFTEFGPLGFLYAVVFIFVLLRLLVKGWRVSKYVSDVILLPGLLSIILQGVISAFVTNFFISPINFKILSVITCILLLSESVVWFERDALAQKEMVRASWSRDDL